MTDSTDILPSEKLIATATLLFGRDGIHATSVDRIIAESGVARMTLYNNFGSKEGLLYAVLEREGEQWRHWFFDAVARSSEGPVDRLRAIFPVLRSWFERDDYFGSAFINAVAEHSKDDIRLRDLTLAHKTAILKRFAELARAAGVAEPEKLAHQLRLLMDGAIVAAMVTHNPEITDYATAAASALIDAAAAGRPVAPTGDA